MENNYERFNSFTETVLDLDMSRLMIFKNGQHEIDLNNFMIQISKSSIKGKEKSVEVSEGNIVISLLDSSEESCIHIVTEKTKERYFKIVDIRLVVMFNF